MSNPSTEAIEVLIHNTVYEGTKQNEETMKGFGSSLGNIIPRFNNQIV
jgi:hypothetical protein